MEDSPADFTGIQIEAANPESKYPLVNIQKAMENGHLYWVFPLKIVIFHGYVSLPEGNVVETMTFAPSPSHHHKYIGGFSTYHSQEVMGWFIKNHCFNH
jgi:hypothetical protein